MSFLIFSSEEITLGFGLGHILAVSAKLMGIPLRQAPLSCPLPLLNLENLPSYFCPAIGFLLSLLANQQLGKLPLQCPPQAHVFKHLAPVGGAVWRGYEEVQSVGQ